MSKDYKRTAESKIATLSIRTVRTNRRAEQQFTARSFDRLIRRGL